MISEHLADAMFGFC